jgi:hypothetical protein
MAQPKIAKRFVRLRLKYEVGLECPWRLIQIPSWFLAELKLSTFGADSL